MRHRLLLAVAVAAAAGAAGCRDPLGGPAGRLDSAGTRGGPAADTVQESDLDLRLDVLAERRPARVVSGRNPFRFGPAELELSPSPSAAGPGAEGAGDAPPEAPLPGAAGPVGPVGQLRFIGVVDAPESAGLIAVLADGADVFQGRVGDTVDGRYRITRIAGDTVEIERLIVGGREVLRLDGLR